MDQELVLFFDKTPEALHLYETFEERILSEIQGVRVRVQKTQITFSNRYNFACVSFLPVRKAKEGPKVYITVTFGLGRKEESPRIDQSTEAYPGRWTPNIREFPRAFKREEGGKGFGRENKNGYYGNRLHGAAVCSDDR